MRLALAGDTMLGRQVANTIERAGRAPLRAMPSAVASRAAVPEALSSAPL